MMQPRMKKPREEDQPMNDADSAELRSLYESCGQGHVFDYWSELDASQRSSLKKTLQELNVVRLGKVFSITLEDSKAGKV